MSHKIKTSNSCVTEIVPCKRCPRDSSHPSSYCVTYVTHPYFLPATIFIVPSFSSVATVGPHPAPVVLCHGICADPNSFLEVEVRGDGGRTRQQICVEKHVTAANCLYNLCLASGSFVPRSHLGSIPGPCWGTSVSRPPVPPSASGVARL